MTLRQSGRFAVISKSRTASPIADCRSPIDDLSTDASSKPRMDSTWPSSSGGAVTSTNSRSQDTRIFIDARGSQRELLQKTEVVFVEQTDVLDAVLQQRHALDPDAKRKARVTLGVIAHRLENG